MILHTYIIIFSFYFSEDLRFEPASPNELQKKPAAKDLVFGKHFTDHWLRIPWSQSGGWEEPVICKLENMNLHPGAKVLHYAQELFEGMKAYRGVDNEIRMFRPMHNMTRMVLSARRSCMPEFDPNELLKCIQKLVQLIII